MKKTFLFILSITFAFGITFYIKKEQSSNLGQAKPQWKTFIKRPGTEIDSHKTTNEEFQEAKIPTPEALKAREQGRAIASINPLKGFMVRDNRILMGEADKKYEDENAQLSMVNRFNPKWKDIMGNALMRFQPEETKLMVKEEVPVIKIEGGKGRLLEQVTITYLQKEGMRSSFKALVDSETGSIVETWDRTIHENTRKPRGELTLPLVDDSGIITK